jgi:hypothetical protein
VNWAEPRGKFEPFDSPADVGVVDWFAASVANGHVGLLSGEEHGTGQMNSARQVSEGGFQTLPDDAWRI